MNDAGVNGFEWHSMSVIGGRPGTGKTLVKDQIIREGFELNKGNTIRVLEFQFEMLARASAVREFSSVLEKPYKYVCSAESNNKITDVDIQACYNYAKGKIKYPVDIVEKPCTITEFRNIITQYMHSNAVEINDKKAFVNTVITIDHSYLFKVDKSEKSKTDMLYNLGEACTELKRKFPIAFIILSQLKREADRPERNEDGKYGNYILDSDILGGDALMQHADLVVGLNRPAQRFIKHYGPDRFVIADESILVMHFLKCRNGDTRMSFFKSEFDKMRITETATPGVQPKRTTK